MIHKFLSLSLSDWWWATDRLFRAYSNWSFYASNCHEVPCTLTLLITIIIYQLDILNILKSWILCVLLYSRQCETEQTTGQWIGTYPMEEFLYPPLSEAHHHEKCGQSHHDVEERVAVRQTELLIADDLLAPDILRVNLVIVSCGCRGAQSRWTRGTVGKLQIVTVLGITRTFVREWEENNCKITRMNNIEKVSCLNTTA